MAKRKCDRCRFFTVSVFIFTDGGMEMGRNKQLLTFLARAKCHARCFLMALHHRKKM